MEDSESKKLYQINKENSLFINELNGTKQLDLTTIKFSNSNEIQERSKSSGNSNLKINESIIKEDIKQQNENIKKINLSCKSHILNENNSRNNIIKTQEKDASTIYNTLNTKLEQTYQNLSSQIKNVENEFKTYVEKSREKQAPISNSNSKLSLLNNTTFTSNSMIKENKKNDLSHPHIKSTNKLSLDQNKKPTDKKKIISKIYKKKLHDIENELIKIKKVLY